MAIESKNSLKRKPKFTKDELEALVNEVGKRKDMLFSKLSDVLSNQKKQNEWKVVTDRVNAMGNAQRTPSEVRRKCTDWSSAVKSKSQLL